MKKFKSSMEISTDNILEVLNCPIIEGIRKETNRSYIEGRGMEPYFSKFIVDVAGFCLPFVLDRGCVLALDICDTWYAFTSHGWDEHKNDQI